MFILPTELPQERAGKYKMDSDPDNLVYWVTNRVHNDPDNPQADFGHQTISFQPQTIEGNDDDSGISMDGNPSTTESSIAAEISILDSYARAISSARSSMDSFPLAMRQETLWVNALDIDEPTGSRTRRYSLEWLDLAAADNILSSTRELLDEAESLIEEPENMMVLEQSSINHEYRAAKHPDVQLQTTSQNESRWGDIIDLDAAFGGSATDLEEDFPNLNNDDSLQYQANPQNRSQWDDNIDLDAAFGGSATDLEEDFPNLNKDNYLQYQANPQNKSQWEENIDLAAAFGGSATDLEEDFPDTSEDGHPQYQARFQDNSKWGDPIDLDAAFGGSATDLEEEFEDANSRPAAVCVANAPLIEGDTDFQSPNLRQHIPEDIEERVDYICRTRFLDGNGHVVAGGWALAKACAEWDFMSEAARENKRLGLFKRQGKIPQEVNRSCATSWEDEEWPTDKSSAQPLATVSEIVPKPCHHFNFQGNPCRTRSNTPPEVSLWVVVTSGSRRHYETFSRQGVIIAQANKLIDPFEYDPTGFDLSRLVGSELKNVVTGKVRKVYLDFGTWIDDVYSARDRVPVPLSYESMMSKLIYWKGTYWHYSLQEPHRINNLLDIDDLVVSKGEIVPPKRHYREPSQLFLPAPSKLCVGELVEDEEPEARPMKHNVRHVESLSRADSNEEDQAAAAADEAALSTSLTLSEIEDSSSPFQSRGSPSSSVSISSEAELTAIDEEKLDVEIDILLEQLGQVQVDQKEEDIQSFVNSLPTPGNFDMLGEQNDEKGQFVVEESVCRLEKACSDPLVNEGMPAPENGYPDLDQGRRQPKEQLINAPQPENTGRARIRALEAVLMREFDFSKKSRCFSNLSFLP